MLVAGVVGAGILLVHAYLVPQDPWGTRVKVGACVSFLFAWWCVLDGRHRGREPYHSGALAVFFSWPLGPIAYLIWSRGARGLLLSLELVALSFALGALGIAGVVLAG